MTRVLDSATADAPRAAVETPAKPTLADVMRQFGPAYRHQHGERLTVPQDRALREIEICRTAALGGQVRCCDACGQTEAFYHACRNRHCPRCSVIPRRQWYQDRLAEVLPTPYFHLVFTLPDTISALALDNAVLIYHLLFTAASQALLCVGRAYTPLRAETGFIGVLHTWGQLLWVHVHLHVLWIGGGLALDGSGWRSLPTGFSLPKKWLVEEFRERFLAGLQRAYDEGTLVLRGVHGHLFAPHAFAAWMQALQAKTWNLHAEPVTRGHETDQTPREAAEQTLAYLARYACGVALSNHRLRAIDGDEVVFTYKDYRDHGRTKLARLDGRELLDRFLLHILPQGLRHIRHYGFLSQNQRTEKLPRIRALLGCAAADADDTETPPPDGAERGPDEEPAHRCRVCGVGTLILQAEWPRPTVAEIMRLSLQELRELRQGRLPFT